MNWRQRAVALVLEMLAVGGFFTIGAVGVSAPAPPVWDGTPAFSTERAWEDVVTLATRFPRRWSGSPGRVAAADWLAGRLAAIGLQTHRASFTAKVGGPFPTVLENVWAISPGTGRPGEIVVALGNYDMAPTSVQAASDTAGHVGTLLELARVVHAHPHHRTFVFLFPDAEEWGMLGARQFARTFPQRRQIVTALSIEDLDIGALAALGIDGVGQFRGYAPMWLRSLAAAAASSEGFPTEDNDPVSEWLQRAVLISATDQGPFLAEGIPAIDLAGFGGDPVLKNQIYHLPGDTIEKMQPASVGAYGRIQERILRSIDQMPEVPRESDFYLRLAPERMAPAWWLRIIQIGVFVPLIVAAAFRLRGKGVGAAAFRDEAIRTGAVLLALVVWLASVKLMPRFGLMPAYELYPATYRHPLLTDIHWVPLLASLAVLAAAGWGLWRAVRRFVPTWAAPPREAGIAISLAWLVTVGIAAMLDNPFGAVTFLGPAVWLWIWIEPVRSPAGRLAAAVSIGAGFLPLILLFARYGAYLQIGWYILWYIFMSLAYGQFSLLRIAIALATVAVALRLFAVAVFSRDRPLRVA